MRIPESPMPCAAHPEVISGLTTCSRCEKQFCGDCIISLAGQSVCGSCKRGLVMDLQSGVKADGLDLAHPGRRLVAQIVDSFVAGFGAMVVAVAALIACMLAKCPALGIGSMYLILFAGMICYEGLMLAHTRRGQTVGKMMMGIGVVNADGGRISTRQAFKRAVARVLLSIIPFLGLADQLMVFSHQRATLHDRSVSTRVVKV